MNNTTLYRFLLYKKASEKNCKLYLEIVDFWYQWIFEVELSSFMFFETSGGKSWK